MGPCRGQRMVLDTCRRFGASRAVSNRGRYLDLLAGTSPSLPLPSLPTRLTPSLPPSPAVLPSPVLSFRRVQDLPGRLAPKLIECLPVP